MVGLLAGCRFRLAGPDFEHGQAGEAVSRAASAVGNTVERIRDQAQRYFQENHRDKK